MKKFYLLFIAIVFGVSTTFSNAQDYRYHQIFIYNFTKYIQWPSSYKSGDFVIGVLGNSNVYSSLERMAETKKVGGQSIKLERYRSPSDVGKCHILYISKSHSGYLDKVKTALAGKPTLLITEKPGMADKGSVINFVIIDGKLKFELNKSAAEKANLRVAGELTRLAILI